MPIALKSIVAWGIMILTGAVVTASDIEILSHDLSISLNPAQHQLSGSDTIRLKNKKQALQKVELLLHKDLLITSVVIDKINGSVTYAPVKEDPFIKKVIIPLKKTLSIDKEVELKLDYKGKINDAVQKSEALSFIVGDSTRGVIAPEGVYLAKSSCFFPDIEDSFAKYEVTIVIPREYHAVSQGNFIEEKIVKNKRHIRYKSKIPSDSLTIVANTFSKKSAQIGEVLVTTYLFPEDAHHADMLISLVSKYLTLYLPLLGPFPYNRFDIVENFFTTGYGLPGFTLLGNQVIKQGSFLDRPGHIDHELVHCWWGNAVYPPRENENWAEGITTYLTNYYRHELEGEEQAVAFRKRLLQKYAVRISDVDDYPVRSFSYKRYEEDNEIGYSKAAMIFHSVRRKLGDAAFFRALRQLAEEKKGSVAVWADFQKAFEQVSSLSLESFFTQWLDRTGGPVLSLEPVTVELQTGNFFLTGAVLQDEPYYELELPIRFRFQGGDLIQSVKVSGGRTPLRYRFETLPYEITIDPYAEVFRKLHPSEVTSCLNKTLEDSALVIVKPSTPRPGNEPYYNQIADRLTQSGATVKLDIQITGEDLNSASLFLLGLPDENGILALLSEELKHPILSFSEQGFRLADRQFSGEQYALLISLDNPRNHRHQLTVYGGYSAAALERALMLFFYGWDSYLVFEQGSPILRADYPVGSTPVSRAITTLASPTKIAETWSSGLSRIRESDLEKIIERLSAKAFQGRLAGFSGDQKTRHYLKDLFEDLGLNPIVEGYEQPFVITVQDVAAANLRITTPNTDLQLTSSAYEVLPLPGFQTTEWRDLEVVYVPQDYSWLTDAQHASVFAGRIILVPAPRYHHPRDQSLWQSLLEHAARNQAAGIIFIAGEEQAECPWCVYGQLMSPAAQEAWTRSQKRAPYPNREMWAAGVQQRGPKLSENPQFTAVVVGKTAIARLLQPYSEQHHIAWGQEPYHLLHDSKITLTMETQKQQYPTANILGAVYGGRTSPAGQWVIVGAHFDHLGLNEQGVPYPGADDNASGVAALLTLAKALVQTQAHLERNVLFVAFSGEEWGLQGSTYLLENPPVPISQIAGMLNLDTIGRNDSESISVIGAYRSNDLYAIFKKYENIAHITVKADLEFAFEYGSDHYPFYLRKIPTVDLCSSFHEDYHRITDTADKINLDKLVRVTKLTYLVLMELAGTTVKLDVVRDVYVPYPQPAKP